MRLEDLIDLEAQLLHDRDAEADVLEARDRPLVASGRVKGRDPHRLVTSWLRALREHEPGVLRPGRQVRGVLRGVRAVLILLGLMLGWTAASAVFAYSGGHPVNVWDFLLAFVGVQLLLFVLHLLAGLFPMASLGAPFLGLFRGVLAWAYPRLAARSGMPRDHVETWRALWHRLRSRRSLYREVEPWVLMGLTQTFGVAFNVGALLACLRLVVFTDVAFGWSTTLVELDAQAFHGLVEAVAFPWAWLWPEAVPSADLVAATRYSRLEGAYLLAEAGRRAGELRVGGWWPFLLTALAVYGLLPRLLSLTSATVRRAVRLRRLPLDDVDVRRVLARLTAPHVETRAAGDEAAPARKPQVPGAESPARVEGPCSVVLWRDAPGGPDVVEAINRHLGCPVASMHKAGGKAFEEGTPSWRAEVSRARGAAVVAESWEAPDRSARGLARSLRESLGPNRPILFLLVGVDGQPATADEARIWREELAALEDPYLSVEPLRRGEAA